MKVFISHSSSDNKFVRTLKDDLIENSIETWFDEDQLDLGDSLSEKLELALEESSHFLIVLSPASVNSEWVRYELHKALKHRNSQLIQKIIPVKYRDCEVPTELANLLYADLSKEVRQIQGDKVLFVSPGYSDFLEKLCKAIRNSERELTVKDKSTIKKEISEETSKETTSIKHHIVKSSYIVLGYIDGAARDYYAEIVKKKTKDKSLVNIKQIRPILLPPLLKCVFKDIEYGEKIYFSKNYFFNEYGHFAGFRKDDLYIAVDPRVRKGIGLATRARYKLEIDTKNKRINFIEK